MIESAETAAKFQAGKDRSRSDKVLGPDGEALRDAILDGDEAAFESLLKRLLPCMLGVARSIVGDRQTAEDVVQETWIAVIKGLVHFQGRSSLKTWIFTILTNRARTRAKADRRMQPMSSLCESESDSEKLRRAGERFASGRLAWMAGSPSSSHTPEDTLLSQETLDLICEQLRSMPGRQAQVVRLRDLESFSASEVCFSLNLSESNQKVLLHRGRLRIRRALENYRQKGSSARKPLTAAGVTGYC